MKKLSSIILTLAFALSFQISCLSQHLNFIPIHFHVLSDASVLTAQLDAQIAELNKIYSEDGTLFRFQRVSIDHDDVKLGNSGDLNVVIQELSAAYGYSSFPWDSALKPADDNIHLDPISLPTVDGDASGIVLAHEIGHWLGLYHEPDPRINGAGNCMDVSNLTISDAHCYLTQEQRDRLNYFYTLFRSQGH